MFKYGQIMNKFHVLLEHQQHLLEYKEFIEKANLQEFGFDFHEFMIIREAKFRELEAKWLRWSKYGILGLVTAATFMIIGGTPLVLFLYWAYRRKTDICRKMTKGESPAAYNKCYISALQEMIKLIQRDLSQLNQIKDEKARIKLKGKLLKQKVKYQQKLRKFRKKLREKSI